MSALVRGENRVDMTTDEVTAGQDVLSILRDGIPRTKTQLAAITKQARSTISLRLDELERRGLVTQLGNMAETGGRPSTLYSFSHDAGLILAADFEITHAVFAVTNLNGTVLAHERIALLISDGPKTALEKMAQIFKQLLEGLRRPRKDVKGIGIGLPGPVERSTGRPISPPIMPGWDGFDVVTAVKKWFDVPVIVDNDVNIMALGEVSNTWKDESDLLVVKVATGIGAGIISGGRLVHGALGAAGDIGHIAVHGAEERLCRCGQLGCLEAIASGRGVAQTLADNGLAAETTSDVIALVRAGNSLATRVTREAGRLIGEVLAACVALLNPNQIVLGGELAEAGEPLLAGIRETIYRRGQPLATRQLHVSMASDPVLAGVIGASRLVQDVILAP
jgi:predicted NBD/HSP70 family sugar kinase